MKFKVMAGNMYCGVLTALPYLHTFVDRNGNISDRIHNYNNLRLIRCK